MICLMGEWIKAAYYVYDVNVWHDFSGLTLGHFDHPIPLPGTEQMKPWIVREES